MRKFLWFKIKEPYEKLVEQIEYARDKKQKIEFSNVYLGKILSKKQHIKFVKWLEENQSQLEDYFDEESEIERIQRMLPVGCSAEVYWSNLKIYFIFDFRE